MLCVCGRLDQTECENAEDLLLLSTQLSQQEEEIEKLKRQSLSLKAVTSAGTFRLWTNLPNREVFDSLVRYLNRNGGSELKYWKGSETISNTHFRDSGLLNKPGPERKLSFNEEIFLVLVKLKTGYSNLQLGHFFGLSDTVISQIFTTHVNFLNNQFKYLFQIRHDDDYTEGFADCFKQWPNLRTVLDCTELQIEKSSNFQARKEMFSNYKQRDTIKLMVGLGPNLCVNYVSKAWGAVPQIRLSPYLQQTS